LPLDNASNPYSIWGTKFETMWTNSPTIFAEELDNELNKIPEQYWSNLLQIIRLFRKSVTPLTETHAPDPLIIEAIEDLGLVHAMQEVKHETLFSLQEALAEIEREWMLTIFPALLKN
jgi:hypothetical protein